MTSAGSKYATLWIDGANAPAAARRKHKKGHIRDDEYSQVMHFIENGYVILPDVIDLHEIDAYTADVNRLLASRPDLW